jgi:flagellar motor switch protein FliM
VSKVLSQEEIDALLSALSSGEIDVEDLESEADERKVKPYDFTRPNKFSKEQLSALEYIYENYSRIVSNYLSSQTRANIKMQQVSIEQVTYEEFIRSIPNPTLLLNFTMPPLGGILLLEINSQFALQLVELLCGGKPKRLLPVRELTDIEISIIQNMLNFFVNSMKEAWQDVVEVSPSLESLQTNPQLNQTMSPTESVALITFVLEVADMQSFANLCIPYMSIEKVVDKLDMQYWFKTHSYQDNLEYTTAIKEKLQSTEVELSILLGSTQITVEDFMSMSVGDVLQLDRKTTEPLEMYVEDQLHFLVQPGLYKGKLSVQIVDFAEKDVHNDE